MSKNDNSEATLVNTPVAVLSYPHIDTPQMPDAEELAQGKKPSYSGAFIFPAGTNLDEMKKAALAAAVAFFGPTVGPSMVTFGGKGSTFRTDMKPGYPEGAVAYINARSTSKPGVVYSWPDPETVGEGKKPKPARMAEDKIKEELYPGVKVRAQLRAYGYNKKGNKGIGWAVNHIQKIADGERLDNRVDAVDAFDADLSIKPADLSALGLA